MEKNAKKSRLTRIPAWAMSLMILFILIALMIILNDPKSTDLSTIQIIGWIFYLVFVTIACFFICRTHPKSVWYTPLICNTVGIIGLIANLTLTIALTNYDTASSEWIILVSSFVLSVTGAIVGARIGRRRINQAK